MIKEHKKEIFIFIAIMMIMLFNYSILNNFYGDNYWNYGFSYNIVNGMIPYRDFNMVLFPFSPFLYAIIMKIFGDKLIIYYLISSIIVALTIYITRKMNKSVTIPILFFFIYNGIGGYNNLSILLFFILIYLEQKENRNNYLIGLIFSLLFMTNQKMIVLIIPLILNRDFKDNIKAFKCFIIPLEVMFIYLFTNNALSDFIDYTFLGLFDFGSENTAYNSLFLIIELLVIVNLIYKYVKTKDINYLYCLCFQIIALPILDDQHVALSLIPFIFFSCRCNQTTSKIINVVFAFLLIEVSIISFMQLTEIDNVYYLNKDINSNYYLTMGNKEADNIDNIIKTYYYENIDDHDIYFVFNSIYYYKLKNDIPINKFDLSLNGNSGYNGNEKLKQRIKEMTNTLFIVYVYSENNLTYSQVNYELISFITTNYECIEDLGDNFYVYEVNN